MNDLWENLKLRWSDPPSTNIKLKQWNCCKHPVKKDPAAEQTHKSPHEEHDNNIEIKENLAPEAQSTETSSEELLTPENIF